MIKVYIVLNNDHMTPGERAIALDLMNRYIK